jgi:hypothetical protein
MQRNILIKQKNIIMTCDKLDEKDGYHAMSWRHTMFPKRRKMLRKERRFAIATRNQATLKNIATSTLRTPTINYRNMVKLQPKSMKLRCKHLN